MKERVDNLVRNHRDDLLEVVLSFFGRLGTVIGVMAGLGALIRFREVVLPAAPGLVFLVAVLLLFVSFGLLVWVAFSGWYKLAEARGYSWGSHAIGLLIMVFSTFFVIAGLHAAITN